MTVANDNTIKACGGTGCHTSWTYTFDGERFRLVDDDGKAPTGGRALPFRDEPERSSQVYEDLKRARAAPLAAQPWQALRRRDNVAAAVARFGRRSEFAVECPGGAADILSIRDLPPAGGGGSPEVKADEILS